MAGESITLKRRGRAHVPPTYTRPRAQPASGRGRAGAAYPSAQSVSLFPFGQQA